MRPATFTRLAAASISSALLPSNSLCKSPANASGRKSLGNAIPWTRNACSLSRRSAINLLSSGNSVASVIVTFSTKSRGTAGAGFQSRFQAGFNEFIQVAVEHFRRIRAFDSRAQILDPRLIEYVIPNLAAPADVGFRRFQCSLFDVAFLDLHFIELGLEHLHRAVAVGMLTALGLARNYNATRHVRDAHCRLGLVDVLAASAGGTVDIRSQVRRVD